MGRADIRRVHRCPPSAQSRIVPDGFPGPQFHKIVSVTSPRKQDRLHEEETIATALSGKCEGRVPRFHGSVECRESGTRTLVFAYAGKSVSDIRLCRCMRAAPARAAFLEALYHTGLECLAQLHKNGVLHMDVHAGNFCMVPPSCDGDGTCKARWVSAVRETLKVVDMGSAVFTRSEGVYEGPTRGGRWGLMHHDQFSPTVRMSDYHDRYAWAAQVVSMARGSEEVFSPSGRKPRQREYEDHPLRCPSLMKHLIRNLENKKTITPSLAFALLRILT